MKPNWKPRKIKLGQIQAWENNPRMSTKAQAQRIIASERKFGQPVPFLVAPEVDGRFLLYDGHQRLAAWFTVYGADYEMDAMVSDRPLTEAEHKELIITLHTGATGSWDWNALSGWSAGDLQEWGMNADALKGWNNDANNLKELLTAEFEPVDAEPQTDRAGELAEKWQTASGQLWKLGEHRLLIGDCTVRENVERLMGGEKATLFVTDPPYGVDYSALRTSQAEVRRTTVEYEDIGADKLNGDDLQKFLESVFSNCKDFLDKNAAWYIWHAQMTQGFFSAAAAAAAADILIHRQIIWVKPSFIFGRGDYHWKHELCFYGWVKGNRPPFYGERNQDTVWMLGGGGSSGGTHKDHPTQKPLEVYEIPIRNHTKNGETILDPFTGSGTAIIAAHNLNRRCFAMEISEKYGAVILQRFLDATGVQPELTDTP